MRLRLADGRELIDGMSSWWCAIHGYRDPRLDRALGEQLERMAHVMFGGLTHEPAVRLAERLLAHRAAAGLDAVFFADSGSVSVEVAIKMACSIQRARGRRERTRLLTVRGGYHGDTFGAMAVCDPVGGMHTHVHRRAAPRTSSPSARRTASTRGWIERWAAARARARGSARRELAAVIIEPVVQGAGGMRFHSPECVALMRELCDEHGLLLDARRDRHRLRAHGRAVRLRACRGQRRT